MWPSQRLASISPKSGHRKAQVRRRDRRTRGIRPIVTLLEERTLLSQLPLTVNSLANSGVGTLQAAIAQANAQTANQYLITFTVTGTIDLTSALPDLANNITIQGPGASSVAVSGGGSSSSFSVFTVNSGVTASISGLTISNGNSDGGGVYNTGNLTLTNDTISGNSAPNGGGGVYNNHGTATLTNDTLSGNSATYGVGGGVCNVNSGTATLTNDTLSGNSATYGGVCNNDGTATLINTIVANSTSGGDISGSVTGNNNLIDDAATAGGFTNGVNGNIVGVNPLLSPLGNYGGPTQTMPLLPAARSSAPAARC